MGIVGGNGPTRYCVIGAGAAGLATCRALLQHGIPFECLEREGDVGGIFNYGTPHSSIYQSVHLLSSKKTTQYPDFPMPAEYPHYPNHRLVLAYFRDYARHFHLYETIRFNTAVERIEPSPAGWGVHLGNGTTKRYRGVIIANGHHSVPLTPEFPGEFSGLALHSKAYKTPDIFQGKRVLIVGAGNSGCDIALDAVPVAERVFLSMRTPVHFLSKLCFGRPGDVSLDLMARLRLPMWMRRLMVWVSMWFINGRASTVGLPQPDHRIFDAAPTVSSLVPYRVAHGDIVVKPNIERLEGNNVRFRDGSVEPIDVIVYATGFKVAIPFIDRDLLKWQNGAPELFLNEFHPERDDLAIVGLFQSATGGHWALMHYQAQLLARFLAVKECGGNLQWFLRQKAGPNPDLRGGFGVLGSERHRLTVAPRVFQRKLEKLIREFDRRYDWQSVAAPDANSLELKRAA